MFQRLATGWQLARQSFHVLRLDSELLLFPLISGIACLTVLANANVAVGAALIVAGVALLLLSSLISSAVNAILLAAIYLYATEGDVPEYFDRHLIEHSFART